MWTIGIRNLLHDKVRLSVTLFGITFAVVLIFVQVGMYLGFMRASSAVIDRGAADIWIVSKNSANFDWSQPFPERYVHIVRSTPGVQRAETLLFAWAFARLPRGGTEQVEIIGYHPSAGKGWGQPWGLVEGEARSVLGGDHVIVDKSSYRRLGELRVGDRLEIMGRSVRIAGLTEGIRPLTTAPYVFASYETAHRIASYVGRENTVFILVQAAPGHDVGEVAARLARKLPHVDVMTAAQCSRRTRWYWTVSTGMGFGFLLTILLGFFVGVTVVGQTIYADAIEHLREYATLKAIGGGTRELLIILWSQAGVAAIVGYAAGTGGAFGIGGLFNRLGLSVVFPPALLVMVAGVTVLMCLGASLLSIRKVLRVDPATVFKA
ncbi:MAG: ABC transporter permease [Planctomycetes bacterium]|nr:ABC transporter permease [Planctomycetota bacterium]